MDAQMTNNYVKHIKTHEILFFCSYDGGPSLRYPGEWSAWKPYPRMPSGMKLIGESSGA